MEEMTDNTMETVETPEKAPKSEFERLWIKSSDVIKVLNISRTMLSNLMNRPDFPKPIRMSYNLIRWNAAEIEQWRKDKEQGVSNGI